MFLCKLLLWDIILNQICVLSVWHELPVPNFKVLLFLCLFIDKELLSSTDFFPRVDTCSLF